MRAFSGHLTWACLLRREMLGLLDACFAFAEAVGDRVVPLWPSVRQELLDVQALLPMLRTDLRATWSEEVACSDASPYGLVVCVKKSNLQLVAENGRSSERWRFKVSAAISARRHHLGAPRPSENPIPDLGSFGPSWTS